MISDAEYFICSLIKRAVIAARVAGLELLDVAGLDYDPFARTARLTDDARVNYLMHFRRPVTAGVTASVTA